MTSDLFSLSFRMPKILITIVIILLLPYKALKYLNPLLFRNKNDPILIFAAIIFLYNSI